MLFNIEGANSEVTKKIKGAEAKLLAKGKAKMPNAKEFKVKMRPNLVKASSGAFYGGHLYGTEDGSKWLKCAEVRIREGKGDAEEAPKPPSNPTEENLGLLDGRELRKLERDLPSFINSKLSKFNHKYQVTGKILLKPISSDFAVGDVKVKVTMDKPILGRGRREVRRSWDLQKDMTRRNIEFGLNLQTLNGYTVRVSIFTAAKDAPGGTSFIAEFSIKLRANK